MINRLQATHYVVDNLHDEPIVASLGNAKFDLYLAKDRPQNFYMWNSMGMASSIGLGLAMARPQRYDAPSRRGNGIIWGGRSRTWPRRAFSPAQLTARRAT